MTTRLSIISFAGMARTLVAVGTLSEAFMFFTTAADAPRRTDTSSSSEAFEGSGLDSALAGSRFDSALGAGLGSVLGAAFGSALGAGFDSALGAAGAGFAADPLLVDGGALDSVDGSGE
ncbi:hypothetical protein JCM12141A_32360 [Mycolicibacterium hodleri]